jgi:predicted nucleic acid-binding protein
MQGAREELEALWRDVNCVELTSQLARRAGDLAESHRLRGYDAVHLASFEEVAADDGVLVTTDDELLAAARARNLNTLLPS